MLAFVLSAVVFIPWGLSLGCGRFHRKAYVLPVGENIALMAMRNERQSRWMYDACRQVPANVVLLAHLQYRGYVTTL